jgi:hypothetical protein
MKHPLRTTHGFPDGIIIQYSRRERTAKEGEMNVRLILRPGNRGTRKLLAQYGKRMVCVRYRYDERLKRRYKTVELIVDEIAWEPKPGAPVKIRIRNIGSGLHQKIMAAGGRWDKNRLFWRIRYDKAIELGLRDRIVDR